MPKYNPPAGGAEAPRHASTKFTPAKVPSPGAPKRKNMNVKKRKGVKSGGAKQNPRHSRVKVKYGANI